MRSRFTTSILAIALGATLAWSEEVELKKDQVPAAVLAAMQGAAAGAELGEFEKETKKDVTVYTATFKGKDGKEMEVTVSPDGKVIKVEAEGDEKDEKGEKHEHEKK